MKLNGQLASRRRAHLHDCFERIAASSERVLTACCQCYQGLAEAMPPRDAETSVDAGDSEGFRALSRAVAVAFLLLPGTRHDVLHRDPRRARAGRPTGSSSYCRDGTNEWMTYTVVDSLLRTDDTVGVGPMRAAHWVVRGRALVSDH